MKLAINNFNNIDKLLKYIKIKNERGVNCLHICCLADNSESLKLLMTLLGENSNINFPCTCY